MTAKLNLKSLFVLTLLITLTGCTSLMQSMAESYVEGSPVADYAFVHKNAQPGDSAFYIDHNATLEMPSPVLSMEVTAVSDESVHICWENKPPKRHSEKPLGKAIFAQMPEMISHMDVTTSHQVTQAYLSIGDQNFHMKVTEPGPGNPILSRKTTQINPPKVHTIGERSYQVNEILIEHWRTDEHNAEWLVIKHMSPDVPFGIVQWELTGTAEIDMNFEKTLISTAELAQALYNPISANDTLNKLLGLTDDHSFEIPIRQRWVFYPSLDEAYAAADEIEESLRQQRTTLDVIHDVLF